MLATIAMYLALATSPANPVEACYESDYMIEATMSAEGVDIGDVYIDMHSGTVHKEYHASMVWWL